MKQIDRTLMPTHTAASNWKWPEQTPDGCPFDRSRELPGMEFTARHAEYTNADTWYPSWAADGNLYSPWTDGSVEGLVSNSAGADATTGYAKILGDDPLSLKVVEHAVYQSDPAPYQSRYPAGSLVHDGVWYYGTYCLGGGQVTTKDGVTYNWPWLGPFVGFRWSTDFGKTWTQTPCTPAKPLFGEAGLNGEPVKIGAPHFVDFGKNMQHSPDGKAYLVAHGASDGKDRRFGYNSWITGDEIYHMFHRRELDSRASFHNFHKKFAKSLTIYEHETNSLHPHTHPHRRRGSVRQPGCRLLEVAGADAGRVSV